MKSLPGTYALILESVSTASARVGKWGNLQLESGYYIYIGSAFGPGGVAARVRRHCRANKRQHWHLDYLRPYLDPSAVWCSYEPRHLEHDWAEVFATLPDYIPIKGFGCSDCACYTHLYQCPSRPNADQFSELPGSESQLYVLIDR